MFFVGNIDFYLFKKRSSQLLANNGTVLVMAGTQEQGIMGSHYVVEILLKQC